MTLDIKKVAQHWNEEQTRLSWKNTGLFWWEAGSGIDEHINCKISGDADIDWVEYTLNKYFGNKLPLPRCLSLGCGNGHLERRLAHGNAFQWCDAYDISEDSLQIARKSAQEEGLSNIQYTAADINRIVLPVERYDAVWVNHAMHHFEALEYICRQIQQSLKPRGLLILNEYIGPSRFQFASRQKEIANSCLRLLPAEYRVLMQEETAIMLERTPFTKGIRWFLLRIIDKLKDRSLIDVVIRRIMIYGARTKNQNILKESIIFPSRRDLVAADPSEAVRSEEILEVLQREFEIIEKKDWGGNIFQFLLAGISGRFLSNDQKSQALLKMILNIEDTLLQCGEFKSDFAYIVAQPKAEIS